MSSTKLCFINTLNGIGHPMLMDSKKGEGRRKALFSNPLKRGNNKMPYKVDSLTALTSQMCKNIGS